MNLDLSLNRSAESCHFLKMSELVKVVCEERKLEDWN